jgi:hypothetical protein
MSESEQWLIVKQSNGQCVIVLASPTANSEGRSAESALEATEQWGAFNSQAEAIARRVGLIRSGKCQPV